MISNGEGLFSGFDQGGLGCGGMTEGIGVDLMRAGLVVGV